MYHDLLANFTGGIASPDVLARVDMEQYTTFMRDCVNGIVKPFGGIYKRMGTVNKGTTYNNGKARLIVFRQPDNDYLLEFTDGHLRVWHKQEIVANITSPYSYDLVEKLKYIKSANTMFIVCGDLPIYELRRNGDNWSFNELIMEIPPFGDLIDDGTTLTFDKTTGDATITANKSFFTSDMIGDRIKVYQEVGTRTQVEALAGTSGGASKVCTSVYVGSSWSLRTSGSWSGTVTLSRSKDGEEYVEYATYVSNDRDFNASDSGSVETNDGYYYRVTFTRITEGTCTVTFTSYSYTAEGIVEITAVASSTSASGTMIRDIASIGTIDEFALSEFSKTNGYPHCIEFFQDRLVLANTEAKPNGLWLSKSGDYTNFDEQIENGSLTDDSAINTSVIARNDYNIKNLITFKDLCVFTGEDERVINGDSTATPSNILIRTQSSWGSTDKFMPFIADNFVVYIQSNGSYIRNFAYNWENDGYTGDELSLRIHSFVHGRTITDYAYTKYPDGIAYFTLDDGTLLLLSYLTQQRVYGWSRFETQGSYYNVESVNEDNTDVLWFVVERDGNYYVERQEVEPLTDNATDYLMLDNAEKFTGVSEVTIPRFAGKEVWALTTGEKYTVKTYTAAADGKITLDDTAATAIIGLGYDFTMSLPEVHTALDGHGSILGQRRTIGKVGLKVYKSFAGDVYVNDDNYPEPINPVIETSMSDLAESPYNTSLASTVYDFPVNKNSSISDAITIRSREPYPLRVLAVVRDIDVNV